MEKNNQKKRKINLSSSTIEKFAYVFNHMRSGHFAWQGAILPWIDAVVNPKNRKDNQGFLNHLKTALPKIQSLYLQDSKNIAEGLYPVSVLTPENPIKHISRIPHLFYDAFRASSQRKKKQTKEFDLNAEELLKDLPDYYKRNFHFQQSGYLGENSAELYEHQVEVLFSGSADAMRRLAIPPLKKHFSNSDGDGLHFLEIGSGTGRLTKFVALAFPKARITAIDLSPHYLSLASTRLKSFRKINYVQGPAENLDFKNETFDGIFSAYLFHELPENIRKEVLTEGFRLLKNKGIYVLADSLQKNDDPELNWALEQFPADFHEPFYKNYTITPMEVIATEAGFSEVTTELGFLTKVVTATKT